MYRRLLVANDGSPGGAKALKAALELAKRLVVELDMICVEELPRVPASIGELREERAEAGRLFRKVIEQARAQAEAAGVVFDAHVVAGHAVTSIVEFVERGSYDLLVIGYLGHPHFTIG